MLFPFALDVCDEGSDGSDDAPSVHGSENDTDNSGNEGANDSLTRKRTSQRKSGQNSLLGVLLSANMPGKSTHDDADMFVTVVSGKRVSTGDLSVCPVKRCKANSYDTSKINTKM